ncbi:hypothetical protein CLIB1423_03S07756 [[Candida] railenensis]|uniref:Uncharacterized protein n=1 Tax=[Candida] railenensis TaxID=45579 RepID=A0A9P0VX01_9ASCO|nr:hypothetical protein CLIB1423_03S07756 [[Candida] railenensis]
MSGADDIQSIQTDDNIAIISSDAAIVSKTDLHSEKPESTKTTTMKMANELKEEIKDSTMDITEDPIITQVLDSNILPDQNSSKSSETDNTIGVLNVEDPNFTNLLKTNSSPNGIINGNQEENVLNVDDNDATTSQFASEPLPSSFPTSGSTPAAAKPTKEPSADSHSNPHPVSTSDEKVSASAGSISTLDNKSVANGTTSISNSPSASASNTVAGNISTSSSIEASSGISVSLASNLSKDTAATSTEVPITAHTTHTAHTGVATLNMQALAPSNTNDQPIQDFKTETSVKASPTSVQSTTINQPTSSTSSAYNGNDYLHKKQKLDYSVPTATTPNAPFNQSTYKPATPPYPPNSYPYKPSQQQQIHSPAFTSPPLPPSASSAPPYPVVPSNKKRLVILYDKLRFQHSKQQLEDLQKVTPVDLLTIIELRELEAKKVEVETANPNFQYLNICIEFNDEFESNLNLLSDFLESNPKILVKIPDIAYHIHFDYDKSWSDVKSFEKEAYSRFLNVLNEVAGKQVVQCSIINKYELKTIYLTERNDLQVLGQEIQEDISKWTNLKVCDYGENFIRFFPGVKFPDGLETLNIGGGYSLETLSGFKIPSRLKTLIASKGCITSIDNVTFPPSLERLDLVDNKIYFLNYVQLPPNLVSLDISQNRVDNLRGVVFPRNLKSLSLAANPIECIKGAKFPESLDYLDLSFLPNESMTGLKFPDSLKELNLQQSMTNTRGLKLPARLLSLNLAQNGVNSINPLKLPNSIQSLHLGKNNIKTLNKVSFPMQLRELYLGDNLITTLKNIQFPLSLEILDMDMDPEWEEHEKYITTLKDVVFPPNLKVLKLRGHKIKSLESFEFPFYLEHLCLAYNELKIVRNIKFGRNLKILDLSGNNELAGIDMFYIPESVIDLRIAEHQVSQLPGYVIERANSKQLTISVSPWRGYGHHSIDIHNPQH